MLTNLRSAVCSLREQWQRSVLSAVGVTVASISIVLLISIALGVRAEVTAEVDGLGVNVIVILPGRVEPGIFNPNLAGQSFLKEEDAARLRSLPGVVRAAPLTFAGSGLRFGGNEAVPTTIAVTPDWFQIRPVEMQSGRTFDESESSADVCVIGSIAKTELFGTEAALGKTVMYDKRPYKVVGVTFDSEGEQSLFSMLSFQNVVYFPYHALKRHSPDMQTDRIMVQSAPDAEPRRLVSELESEMARRLDRQQFSVLTQEDLLSLVYKIMSILTWLLTGLTSIALFVGGVGIMAVMLMSVNERAKEIGVRKTVGARNADVFWQFLAEAVIISGLGGMAGLGISYIVARALAQFTPIDPMITSGVVALSLGVCVALGAVFGVLPAIAASRKDPVEALRAE